jgi:hypothetical protein
MNVVEFEPARAPKKPPSKKPKQVTRSKATKVKGFDGSTNPPRISSEPVTLLPSDGHTVQPALESFFAAFQESAAPVIEPPTVRVSEPVTVKRSDGEVVVEELARALEHLWLAGRTFGRIMWRFGREALR